MARMRAIEAAVRVMEREGVKHAFGLPGAAINPLYAAMMASTASPRSMACTEPAGSETSLMERGRPRSFLTSPSLGMMRVPPVPATTHRIFLRNGKYFIFVQYFGCEKY